MARYVEADKLIEKIKEVSCLGCDIRKMKSCPGCTLNELLEWVENSADERRCGMIAKETLLANTDYEKFSRELANSIYDMQQEGLNVEVQYQPLIANANQVVYSALVLGRLKGE